MRRFTALLLSSALVALGACHRHGHARCAPDADWRDGRCLQRGYCPYERSTPRMATVPGGETGVVVVVLDTMGTGGATRGRPVGGARLRLSAVPAPKRGASPLDGLPFEHAGWGRPVVATAETDSVGAARLDDLESGSYALGFRRVGYQGMTYPLVARRGFVDTLELHPVPAMNCP